MSDPSVLRTADEWRQRAASIAPHGRALVNGLPVDALSGASFECLSPIDGRRLASVVACEDADVDAAVASARAAFGRGDWASQSPAERKRVMLRWADLIERHGEELALLETLDTGKPIRDSLLVDVPSTARCRPVASAGDRSASPSAQRVWNTKVMLATQLSRTLSRADGVAR